MKISITKKEIENYIKLIESDIVEDKNWSNYSFFISFCNKIGHKYDFKTIQEVYSLICSNGEPRLTGDSMGCGKWIPVDFTEEKDIDDKYTDEENIKYIFEINL